MCTYKDEFLHSVSSSILYTLVYRVHVASDAPFIKIVYLFDILDLSKTKRTLIRHALMNIN